MLTSSSNLLPTRTRRLHGPSHASRLLSHRTWSHHPVSVPRVVPATSAGSVRWLPLRAGPARNPYPSTTRTPTPPNHASDSNPLSGFYSDSAYEFDFRSDPEDPESEDNSTEHPLSGPASGLVITSTPAGRFVYWPDRKPADLISGDSHYIAYIDSLSFQEGTPLARADSNTRTEVALLSQPRHP
jgi:hypothetical protein